MSTYKKVMAVLAVVLALLLSVEIGGYFLFRSVYTNIDGELYKKTSTYLDLRGQNISQEHFLRIQEEMPYCHVDWDVPFQGNRYDSTTTELTVQTLSGEDIIQLDFFPELKTVDASRVEEYENVMALRERRPECKVLAALYVGNRKLQEDVTSLQFRQGEATAKDLRRILPYLKDLRELSFEDPWIPGLELQKIQEEFPKVHMTWEKLVQGESYPMDTVELDLSGKQINSLTELEAELAYYPELQKVIMEHCGFGDESMAAFRERVRDQYQVVWGVQVGQAYVRTDQQGFIPSNTNKRVTNEDANQLKYCEGLISVDLGHIGVTNLSWVSGTPHLKYLIVGDSDVKDEHLKPLAQLKELEFLEVFRCNVKDISPILEIKSLRDLNLSETLVELDQLMQLTWVENLWLLNCPLNRPQIDKLQEKLPNTHIEAFHYMNDHGKGWRRLPRYYEMRDILGMWYMKN